MRYERWDGKGEIMRAAHCQFPNIHSPTMVLLPLLIGGGMTGNRGRNADA